MLMCCFYVRPAVTMGEVEEEDAGKEGEGDQILAGLGNIGPWQWRIILITGLFSAPCSTHIMIMTFMNAEVTLSS